MAINVTQKDKTLQEIIAWCEQLEIEGLRLANALLLQRDMAAYGVVKGQVNAYGKIADHCRSMLDYSGSMPSEVPNQSEDADQAQCGYASCLTYEDWDDSSEDSRPQVGDYGVAILENAHGQEEIPFHIEREEHTGLPVALLNTRLYAKPEDDIDDGQYASLFQLYLDGYMLSRTGRNAAQDQSEDVK